MKIGSLLKVERQRATLQNLDSLFSLYLPILNSKTICLYQYLYFVNQKIHVADLLQVLNFSLSEFEAAREHLEAIQLLDTYENANFYTLVPKTPLSKVDFLKQPALCRLLEASLGELAFNELKAEREQEGQNISKKFAEVFILPNERAKDTPATVKEEFQLAEAVVNETVSADLTNGEQTVIKMVQKIAPQDFLATLKNQNHGYVTEDEILLIQKLQNERKINAELINMVIYLSLGREKQPKLIKKFVDTVILDWLQNNVKTAVGAMNRIKQRENNQQIKKKQRPIANKTTVGQVPEWANQKFEEEVSKEEMEALNARLEKYRKANSDG